MEVAELTEALQRARADWPPDQEKFESLSRAIEDLERRSRMREEEYLSRERRIKEMAKEELEDVKRKCFVVLEERDMEVERFRVEMGGLLMALESLKRDRL